MQLILFTSLGIFFVLIVSLLLVFRGLVSKERLAGLDAEALTEFSTSKYRPMARLLSEADFDYLVSQPGYTEALGRRFRADRRRIFRAYLRSLRRDFSRLYIAAKLVALYSPEDRPDLAMALLKRRAAFTIALATIEYRLVLHRFGLATVDVSGLVEVLERMQAEVRGLIAPVSALAQTS